jgi:hypothetical protein
MNFKINEIISNADITAKSLAEYVFQRDLTVLPEKLYSKNIN